MRKLLAITLILALLVSVTGCKKQSSASDTTNTQQNPAQQDPTQDAVTEPTIPQENPTITQKPMYAVSLVPQTEETVDESGMVRFRYKYQNISLIMPEPSIAERIILDYHNRMDKADQYADSVRVESMRDEYKAMGATLMNYIEYKPARFDTGVLSLNINQMIYLGGVHPDYVSTSVTYDLLTGNVLKLSDVLNSDITPGSIANTIVSKLTDKDYLWPNFEEIIAETLTDALDTCEIWYFNNNGLCFHYDPYVLAPYAAGPITVEIPYSELLGVLRDEYFPAEQDSFSGSLTAEMFTADTQKDFTQFAETVLVENGTKFLLSADGAITDITIETESVESGTTTVMAVQSLTPGDAIMVEFDPSAKLLITYRNGNQYETKSLAYINDKILIS